MKLLIVAVDVQIKKILLMKVTTDGHVHDDNKILSELIENIIRADNVTVEIGKLLGDDGSYECNDVLYVSNNAILSCIKVRMPE